MAGIRSEAAADGLRLGAVAVVTAMTLVQALVTMAVLTLPAVAPEIAAALGVPAALIGFQVSLVYAAAMLASLFGGVLVARLGACRTSQLSLLLAAAACLLALLPHLVSFAVASLVLGFAYGLPNPAASHLLALATSPRNRNLVFSIKQTGVPLGGVAAGLIGPPIALAFGWEWALVAVLVPTLLLMLLLQPVRADWDRDRDPTVRLLRRPFAGLVELWRRPPLRWLALMGFCFAGIQLCLMTFLVVLLVSEAGFGLVAAGVVLAAVQFSGAAGRILWGWVADRIGDGGKVLLALAVLMLVAAVVIGNLFGDWPHVLVYLVFIGFGLSAIGWNGVFLAEAARLSPVGRVGVTTGSIMVVTYAGVMVGPAAFAGAYGGLGSYAATFGLLGLPAAAGFAMILLARRPKRAV